MCAKKVKAGIDALREIGWHIVSSPEPLSSNFCDSIKKRYPSLPEDYLHFLKSIQLCTNGDDTAWFLSIDDFNGQSDCAFVWDEFERQSIEAAGEDTMLLTGIKRFWDQHIPILISVKSGYAYAGISLKEQSYGQIVIGYELEYEEAQLICDTFAEFVTLITAQERSLVLNNLL